jgi:hypothetical protein
LTICHDTLLPCHIAGAGVLGSSGAGKTLLLALAVMHCAYAALHTLLRPLTHRLMSVVYQACNWLLAATHVLIYLAYQSDNNWGVSGRRAGWDDLCVLACWHAGMLA